jgi:hypothetical protein
LSIVCGQLQAESFIQSGRKPTGGVARCKAAQRTYDGLIPSFRDGYRRRADYSDAIDGSVT